MVFKCPVSRINYGSKLSQKGTNTIFRGHRSLNSLEDCIATRRYHKLFRYYSHVLQRDPHLIFSMDETSLGANREFKDLRDNKLLPIQLKKKNNIKITN